MWRLAYRQLRHDLLRTLLTAFALGSVIGVILVLEGFEQGQYLQLNRVVMDRKADLIVTQAGVRNFIAVRSSIPQLSRSDVEEIDGVADAHPITSIPVIYVKENKRTPVYVLVYDTRGGPTTITQGQTIQDGRDIVIDYSLAEKHHIQIGDPFVISDFEFTVVGFTKEAAFFTPFAFVNYDGMIDLFIESEIARDLSTYPLLSYMLVELQAGANRDEVARLIEQHVPYVDVYTPEQLAARDVNMGKTFLGPIMGLLIMVAYVVGLLVVGLIMYAEVCSRKRHFAILKALGFGLGKLVCVVLVQAFILVVIALPIGILLGGGLSLFINSIAPLYLVHIFEREIFLQTIFASLVFALLGACVPLRTVQRSDPMMAFQGG